MSLDYSTFEAIVHMSSFKVQNKKLISQELELQSIPSWKQKAAILFNL